MKLHADCVGFLTITYPGGIYLTARDQDAVICGQIGQGVDFIAKPFAIDTLTSKVKEVLARNGSH